MRHGSLFSGIGGFDLAAEWMGWENVFHCEWMPFPRQVLHHHFPNSISYEDITKTDFTIHRGTIDILTGGFPCQPYSSAGKRLGKDDERHLWPHMLRAIQEIQPTYVVGENVRGITNWNGGLVFEEVCAELENEGYEVIPFILPACSVGAPHRRDRVWFIAHSNCHTRRSANSEWENKEQHLFSRSSRFSEEWIASNTNRFRCEQRRVQINSTNGGINAFNDITESISNFQNFPTQSPICSGDDGLPTELDGITFSKWRQESIKGYGNAIVPQVAYEIFKVIQQLDGN